MLEYDDYGRVIVKRTAVRQSLIDKMCQRNDEIDNAVYDCICILAEKELEWNMEVIGDVTDSIKGALSRHSIRVRHPGIAINENGIEEYCE